MRARFTGAPAAAAVYWSLGDGHLLLPAARCRCQPPPAAACSVLLLPAAACCCLQRAATARRRLLLPACAMCRRSTPPAACALLRCLSVPPARPSYCLREAPLPAPPLERERGSLTIQHFEFNISIFYLYNFNIN